MMMRAMVAGTAFSLCALSLSASASNGPSYLDPTGTTQTTRWFEDASSSADNLMPVEWYSGVQQCEAYNVAASFELFATVAGMGIQVSTKTDPGDIFGVFVPPQSTYVWPQSAPGGNASGAWWTVLAGPFFKVTTGKKSSGAPYEQLTVYTGFVERQVQNVMGWFQPVELQKFWLTQSIQLDDVGFGAASCSGSASPPAGCEQCN